MGFVIFFERWPNILNDPVTEMSSAPKTKNEKQKIERVLSELLGFFFFFFVRRENKRVEIKITLELKEIRHMPSVCRVIDDGSLVSTALTFLFSFFSPFFPFIFQFKFIRLF